MVRGRALAAAASIVLLSCTWLIGLPDLPDAGMAADGGSEATPCRLNIPPVTGTSAANDPVSLTAAVSQWHVGQSDGGPYYGFNLDNTCTCPAPSSCQRDGAPACDDPGGVDDSALQVFAAINNVLSDGGVITEASFNASVASGSTGFLVVVGGYNGLPDDSQVSVTLYASRGTASSAPPKLDGTDVWTIDPASASGTFTTSTGYVANNELVATGLALQIIVGTALGPVTIPLDEAVLTATIQMNGTSLKQVTNGMIGGRLDPAKFLPSLQNVPDAIFDAGYLCGSGDVTYQVIKQRLCSGTDIATSGAGDGKGACQSVSFGIGFEAVPANKGATKAGFDAGFPCGTSWSDHC